MEDHNNFLDSQGDEEIRSNKDQKLESTKGKMGEAREENKRLKFLLEQLVNDNQSQQTNFFDIFQQGHEPEDATKDKGMTITTSYEENELVSLSLGISSKGKATMDEEENSNRTQRREDGDIDKRHALGLDLNFDPVDQAQAENESSFVQEGKEEPTEMWPPSKVLKTLKNGDKSEASQHTQLKKTRVSIRARCDTQTMNDGCQWRKYGQKMAKGNPCPRAYYRCTVSPSCPVRKQVQRCAEDMTILITTYEGTHNHPLPMSATAMASTTSAAASMLQSPSLSSHQGQTNLAVANSIINSGAAFKPNALNFSAYQISRPHQFYFPNSIISTLNSHPTVTLDLTANPICSNPRNFTSNFSYIPKFSSRNLNFSSAFSPLQSSIPQSPWNNNSGYFNSGTLPQNRIQGGYLLNTGKQPTYTTISQQSWPDPVVGETKAITSNLKFQSALTTALTECVGNEAGGGMLKENHVLESAELNLKLNRGNAS